AITQAEIAAYRAQRSKPLELSMGETQIALPGASTGAGIFAGKLFAEILRAELAQSGNANTEAAVVEGTKRALSGFAVSDLPHDLGATGFAATDNSGQAVACAMTMNGPFGSGHSVPGVGVTLARAPASSTAGLASAFLTPVLATDAQGNLALAGAGAGGPVGTASIADALARLAKGEAVTRRASNAANGDTLYDTVNAILCQNDSCTALPDAGASGLGMAP
ncbi:MAG: gamma-glutamyltransferase, partial [Alphaproteobacteria bacterium]|nr:gamma-glutamyltransferase [Alphaproteobacteria bacterium]